MSQMRKSIITGEWVIFAANRGKKPYAYRHNKRVCMINTENCPFCEGNEYMTTPERYRTEKDGHRQIRVFKNMYPAVDDVNFEENTDTFYESTAGKGFHEILVDTPVHGEEPHMFSIQKMHDVLCALKNRAEVISDVEGVEYVQVFKNNGPMAGASIPHSHWQIIGLPLVPMEQERAVEAFKKYKKEHGKCLLCDMLQHEIDEEVRIVYENEHFVVFIPYAAKFAYELWIVPRKHTLSFKNMTDEQYYGLADAMKKIISASIMLKDDICYNVCFQDAPKVCTEEDYHWYLRIIPRIGAFSGFENGTSSYINPILPEQAAENIRQIIKNQEEND